MYSKGELAHLQDSSCLCQLERCFDSLHVSLSYDSKVMKLLTLNHICNNTNLPYVLEVAILGGDIQR